MFHIQTEDSGVKNPRIVTHLFADGGRIIKTARTEYADLVGRSDVQSLVRQMMKDQHNAMFSALRSGELDAGLEAACGPLPLPPEPLRPQPKPTAEAVAALSRAPVAIAAELGSRAPVSPDAATVAAPSSRKSRPPTASSSRVARGVAPSRSIFGEGVISEKSLDEVILSYLAEDLDGSSD